MGELKTWMLVFLSVVLCCLTITTSFANEVLIGRVNDWPPLYFKRAGVWEGISVDAYRALANEAGVDLELRVIPWSRAMREIKSLPLMIGNLGQSEDRRKIMHFLGPHHYETMGILMSKEYANVKITSFDDLIALVKKTGKKVVTQQDVYVSEEFNRRIKDNTDFKNHFQIRASKLETSVTMIRKGRALGLLGEKSTLIYLIQSQHMEDQLFVHDYSLADPEFVYLGVSKSISEDLFNKLKQADIRLKEKKVYEKLMKKWIEGL